jgi:thiol-disulfide isomerase/thioredoxin
MAPVPSLRSLSSLIFMGVLVSGCSRAESNSGSTGANPADSAHPQPAPAGASAPLVLARGIRFVKAGAGDVPELVRTEREKAEGDGRDLIVYVGAKWCEPCQRFHHAVQRGELDADFPELTILEFDLDDDRDRINAAGYASRMIPLFVKPGADGRGTDRRFEGGAKGERAVASIAPKLRKLLEK